jgi:hypothetical protein
MGGHFAATINQCLKEAYGKHPNSTRSYVSMAIRIRSARIRPIRMIRMEFLGNIASKSELAPRLALS